MAKPKGSKLKLSYLPSFQICRPKKPSSMAKSPVPAVKLMYSPVNCKSFDISYLSFPDAPPSTPSMISPFEYTSHPYSERRNREKLSNLSNSDETSSPVTPSRNGKKSYVSAAEKSKAMANSYENDDNVLSSPPSFNSSYDHLKYSFKTGKKSMQQTNIRPQRLKNFQSKERYSRDEHREIKSAIPSKFMPCIRNAKVNESFVVVKKSVDPYEDFKNSMLEMVLEKEMFDPKELEHLLMSFLSLNSRIHHEVIIKAFTEIMQRVFCG
ncbi:transcription repressor OFP8-like [Andrographis paniculata]|uniref:transcription repressor OFP8-like n=1 Tax=Andrographis paniculata TaxID=175694 RepID=UPI0021E89D60|nr:transcription repressor OFP8-like [Andrographis paniculata]